MEDIKLYILLIMGIISMVLINFILLDRIMVLEDLMHQLIDIIRDIHETQVLILEWMAELEVAING